MMKVLFTKDSWTEDLLYGASPRSDLSLFFNDYVFSFGFEPVEDGFQYDFTRMTDEANGSAFLAELNTVLSRECNIQRLGQ